MLIQKDWGYEDIFINNELYCGKTIMVRYNECSSNGKFHYHKIKDETFCILSGILKLDYIVDNQLKSIIMNSYDTFRIKPYVRHRFTGVGINGCTFLEVSTTDSVDDSYREMLTI